MSSEGANGGENGVTTHAYLLARDIYFRMISSNAEVLHTPLVKAYIARNAAEDLVMTRKTCDTPLEDKAMSARLRCSPLDRHH